MVALSAGQSVRIFGLWRPRPVLTWADVLRQKLTLDDLLGLGLRAGQLVLMQPDPAQWVQHAGAGLRHARLMQPFNANPFVHLGADLGDVLAMKLSVVEMVRMGITHAQLVAHGMDERTERMFHLDDIEWQMLGRRARSI